MKYYFKKNILSIIISFILIIASFMLCVGIQNDAFSSELSIKKYDINLKINKDGSGSFDNYITYDFDYVDYTVIYEDIVDEKGQIFSYGDINGYEKTIKYNSSNDTSYFDLSSFKTRAFQNDKEINLTQVGYSFNNDIEMDTGDRVKSPYRNGERIYCYYRHGYNQDTTFNFQYKINGMVSKYLDIGIVNWILSPSTDVCISNLSVNITFEETLTNDDVKHLKNNVFIHGYINYSNLEIDNNGIRFNVDKQRNNESTEIRFGFNNYLVSEVSENNSYDFESQGLLNEVERLTKEANDDNYNRYVSIKVTSPFILIILIVIVILGWINAYKKYDKERVSSFESEYYRELTGDYPPAVMGYLYNFQDTTKDDLSATIMDLIRKGYISLDLNGSSTLDKKPNYIYRYNRNLDKSKLTRYEVFVLEWYFDHIAHGDSLTLNDIDAYLKKEQQAERYLNDNKRFIELVREESRKYKFFDDLKDLVGKYMLVYIPIVIFMFVSVFFQLNNYYDYSLVYASISLGLLIIFISYLKTIKRRSESGNEDYVRWEAFKNFLLDFGKFEDYSMPLISIWEHYMVYAVSFGIADKVEEQMRLHFKSMGEDKGYERYTSSSYMMRSRCYIYVRHSCYNSTQLANATIAQARSSSGSGGYGGGRSFGGGGGGHGGR